MIPIGSSSSRTKGRLVMTVPRSTLQVACCARQSACHAPFRATCCRVTCNARGRAGEWLLRHVQRRVQLTLWLGGREAGAGFAATAADDFPPAVLGLQRLGGEWDDLARRGAREDHVNAAGTSAQLQLGEQCVTVARARRRERRGIDDHQARRHVGKPAAERDHERLEPPRELLGDGPAFRAFDGPEVVIDEENLGVVRRDEQRGGKGGGADHEGQVAGLEAAHRADERAIRFEAPVRGGALRRAQRAMLLAPARERREAQPPGDDAVDVLEQQDFGEEVLLRGALLELAYRLVADLQQVCSRERVLVFLDALQQELLIFLFERARRPPRGPGALLPREAQHGSTCTVTSCSRRSRLSRSSTWSAMACADSTSA